jgi:hypothetical protein
VPLSGITLKPAGDNKNHTSDFTILVQFKDDAGQVLDKMSQRYTIVVPDEELERAKKSDVLFYREPVLFPGVFTMEVVVYDANTSKATVRLLTVDLPEVDPKALRLSSVVAVRRSEKVAEAERGTGPLYVGDQLLSPNLGDPFSKAAVKELPFYFVAYPVQGGGELKATLELLSNGQRLAEAPLQLAAPDSRGHIAQVSRIPLEALQPGTYELRIALHQGTQSATRALSFRVAP